MLVKNDNRPRWLKLCLAILSSVFMYRFISFFVEISFNEMERAGSFILVYIASWEPVLFPAITISIVVVFLRCQENILARKKLKTNYICLAIFVILALHPLNISISGEPVSIDMEEMYAIEPNTHAKPISIEFRLVEQDESNAQSMTLKDTGGVLLISNEIALDKRDIESAGLKPVVRTEYDLVLTLSKQGSEKMFDLTKNNIGKRLGILVNGELVSAPVILSALAKHVRINGNYSERDALEILNGINEGTDK